MRFPISGSCSFLHLFSTDGSHLSRRINKHLFGVRSGGRNPFRFIRTLSGCFMRELLLFFFFITGRFYFCVPFGSVQRMLSMCIDCFGRAQIQLFSFFFITDFILRLFAPRAL